MQKIQYLVRWAILLCLGNFLLAMHFSDVNLSDRFEKKVYKDMQGNKLPYRLLKPKVLDQGGKYPLVVLLHGIGEKGDDNEAQLKWGAKEFTTDDNMAKYPCYVAVPQCPKSDFWASALRDMSKDFKMPEEPTQALQMTLELIDVLQEEFPNIDPDRLYITGLSMGGFGTWDAIQRKPDLFAAAVPICGGGDISKADRLAKIPIWAFHGAEDLVVNPKWSRDMVEAIRKTGGNPKYTEYPDVGHNSWIPAYSDPELFEWLFSQKKER
ncbi:MAG: prolyl oligopeptidase family serine peptidase [Candidatus Aminicenantes bacterium]|nr:MAG: prolyl oligopeptidase family serine peptidase [Candidatus Aminicenantes bacterium]